MKNRLSVHQTDVSLLLIKKSLKYILPSLFISRIETEVLMCMHNSSSNQGGKRIFQIFGEKKIGMLNTFIND